MFTFTLKLSYARELCILPFTGFTHYNPSHCIKKNKSCLSGIISNCRTCSEFHPGNTYD